MNDITFLVLFLLGIYFMFAVGLTYAILDSWYEYGRDEDWWYDFLFMVLLWVVYFETIYILILTGVFA